MPHDHDRVRIAAELLGVIVNPPDRLGDVGHHVLHGHVRDEAVVGCDENEAFIHEDLRLLQLAFLVSCFPAASVNPEDDGAVFALGWGVHVESLPGVLRLGVGHVTENFWFGGEER